MRPGIDTPTDHSVDYGTPAAIPETVSVMHKCELFLFLAPR
jgi:hypothetical protein